MPGHGSPVPYRLSRANVSHGPGHWQLSLGRQGGRGENRHGPRNKNSSIQGRISENRVMGRSRAGRCHFWQRRLAAYFRWPSWSADRLTSRHIESDHDGPQRAKAATAMSFIIRTPDGRPVLLADAEGRTFGWSRTIRAGSAPARPPTFNFDEQANGRTPERPTIPRIAKIRFSNRNPMGPCPTPPPVPKKDSMGIGLYRPSLKATIADDGVRSRFRAGEDPGATGVQSEPASPNA